MTVTLRNKSGFVSDYFSLIIKLVSEYPFCSNNVLVLRFGSRSHTSFLWNWLSSFCIASIHPSSERASSTVVGSINDNNPIIDSSCLKYDLVLLGLSLFTMIWSSGCEDLYLNVFLAWLACWEPSSATSEATSSWHQISLGRACYLECNKYMQIDESKRYWVFFP